MYISNFKFNTRVDNPGNYEHNLLTLNPVFRGTDHQIDTFL